MYGLRSDFAANKQEPSLGHRTTILCCLKILYPNRWCYFQGKLVVAAKSGVKLEIPDGAVIANKVIYIQLRLLTLLIHKVHYLTLYYWCRKSMVLQTFETVARLVTMEFTWRLSHCLFFCWKDLDSLLRIFETVVVLWQWSLLEGWVAFCFFFGAKDFIVTISIRFCLLQKKTRTRSKLLSCSHSYGMDLISITVESKPELLAWYFFQHHFDY